jgi:hypothetical protein
MKSSKWPAIGVTSLLTAIGLEFISLQSTAKPFGLLRLSSNGIAKHCIEQPTDEQVSRIMTGFLPFLVK